MAAMRDNLRLRLLLIAILAILLLGAKGNNTMVMTLINKSGMPIAVSLVSEDRANIQYLTFPEGDRTAPFITRFEIIKNAYRMRVYWLEEKDPVTGRDCVASRTSRLVAVRNIRVVVGRCDERPRHPGEPTMYKFGRWRCME